MEGVITCPRPTEAELETTCKNWNSARNPLTFGLHAYKPHWTGCPSPSWRCVTRNNSQLWFAPGDHSTRKSWASRAIRSCTSFEPRGKFCNDQSERLWFVTT